MLQENENKTDRIKQLELELLNKKDYSSFELERKYLQGEIEDLKIKLESNIGERVLLRVLVKD